MNQQPTELDYLLKDERLLLEDLVETEGYLAILKQDIIEVREKIKAEQKLIKKVHASS